MVGGVLVPLFTQLAQDGDSGHGAAQCKADRGLCARQREARHVFSLLKVAPLVTGGPQGWECSWSR